MSAPKSKTTKPAKRAAPPIKATDYSKWFLVAMVATVFILYGRSIHYKYVKMDDSDLIVANDVFIRHLKNIPQAFRQSCFEIPGHLTENKSYYRPLLIVSFMLDAQVKGASGLGVFHFMNIIYHLLCCVLLFWLLRKLLVSSYLAAILAFIFAVHPVNVQAIAWIPGRNDILLAIFGIISLIGLIDYQQKGKTSSLVIHLGAFVFALFTKESGVILLPLYFMFMWLWMRDLSFYKRKFFVPILYLVITALWFFAMQAALKGAEKLGGGEPIFGVIEHNLSYMLLYIGKILFPFNLNTNPETNSTGIALGIASLVLLVWIFLKIKDWRKAVFAAFWYFIFIAPTLIVPELPAYEHRDYFPLIGLIAGISQASFFEKYNLARNNINYVLGGFCIVFIILTATRIPVFSDMFTYWTDATEGTPFAPIGCVNMGQNYQDMHDNDPELDARGKDLTLKKAGEWNHRALEMDSTTRQANNNYGAYLYLTGHRDEALPYFIKETKFHPTNSDPYKNIAIYYRNKGMPEKSVPYWIKLISLNKYNLDAYQDLATYYRSIGDFNQALYYSSKRKDLNDEAERNYKKIK